MNKYLKWFLWTVATVVIIFGGLVGLGYNMMKHGTEYLEAKGATNVRYLGNANEHVFCRGNGTGMAFRVDAPTGEKDQIVAVCISGLGTVSEAK